MMKKWIKRAVFIVGCLLCLYPLISDMSMRRRQEDVVSTYHQTVKDESKENLKKVLNEAKRYNSLLYQSQGAVVDNLDLYSDDIYNMQMDVTGTGIMGSLNIPKINVNLPIYHGTEEEVLAKGVGHIKGTSLPVGGENTHCVLSGHRGLPESKLLVRLDEMEKGDYFFVTVCGQKMAYKITEIHVVDPEDVSDLQISSGEDKISLVTCTPYGINTHRLIVSALRTEYEESMDKMIQEGIPSVREIIFRVFPFGFMLLAMILYLKDRRCLKNEKMDKHSVCNICTDSADDSSGSGAGNRSRRKNRINSGKSNRCRRKKIRKRNKSSMCKSSRHRRSRI